MLLTFGAENDRTVGKYFKRHIRVYRSLTGQGAIGPDIKTG